jgi:hypothetical protein
MGWPRFSLAGKIEGIVLDSRGTPVLKAVVLAVNVETGKIGWWNCENANKSYGSDGTWVNPFNGRRWRRRCGKCRRPIEGGFPSSGLRSGKFHILAAHPRRNLFQKTSPHQAALTLFSAPNIRRGNNQRI